MTKRWPFAIWTRRLTRRWVRHRHTDNAAALSFYGLVSLAPLLLFGVTLASFFLGEGEAHGELERQLTAVIGAEAARLIEGVLQSARIAPRSDPYAFGIAMLTFLYAGSHVLSKLRDSLNLVFEVGLADPSRRWLARMLSRGLCASMLLIFGVILVGASAMEGVAAYVTSHMIFSPWFDAFDVQKGLRWLTTYAMLAVTFLMVLKILPRRRPLWRHAAVGAIFGSIVAGSLKGLLDLFLRHSVWASFIGSGLTVLVFLFWLFLSIQAFLAGAEITAWLGRRQGPRRWLPLPPHPDSHSPSPQQAPTVRLDPPR